MTSRDDPRKDPRHWGTFLAWFVGVTLYYWIGTWWTSPGFDEARAHALALWELQVRLGLDVEPAIQQAVDGVTVGGFPWLTVLLVLVYVGPHFLLTFGMFAWVYVKRFEHFARVRNVFVAFTVLSFGFQWILPLAPPRMLPELGIRYTLDEWLPVTGDDPTVAALTNPLAAFPSVHTGWSFLVAYFMVDLSRGRKRHLWWLYPGTIILSVLATGNHFILDLAGAVPFLAAAFLIDRWVRNRPVPGLAAVPRPTSGGGDTAFEARLRRLHATPARPRSLKHPRNWVAGFRLFVDYALTVPPFMAKLSGKIRRYPEPFEKVTITARDGTRLKAWLGTHGDQPRPALVIVPGLFTSKDNYVVRKRALRVFGQWGFHVLTLDMRGNGESERVPSTPGWKEAEDLVDVAAWLRRHANVDGVAVYGESLAATAAVLAAGIAADEGVPFADRGVISVSGFTDAEDTIANYTDPPNDRADLREVAKFFTGLLRLSGNKVRDFREFHEHSARHYGLAPDEAARRSSPIHALKRLDDPVLVLHSHDDTLVPVHQAKAMVPLTERLERLGVWVLPWGHHCLYEMAEPDWFWSTLAAFFDGPTPAPSAPKAQPKYVPDHGTLDA